MTYSSSMSLSRSRYAERNQNIFSFRADRKGLGPVSNSIVLVVLLCILGLFYIAQVTKTSALGYQVNELQTKHGELQKQHDELQVAAARLQSLDRVASSKPAKTLVTTAPTATIAN